MTTPGYIIWIYRDRRTGWQDVEVRFTKLKDAKHLADAIAADTKDGPVLVKVEHPATNEIIYGAAGGKLGDVFPGRTPT